MKNKYKIIFVKIILSITFTLLMMGISSGLIANIFLYGDLKETINYFSNITLFSGTFVGLIFLILLFTVDIRPEKTKPTKYKIAVNNFKELKEVISNKLTKDGYGEFEIFQNDLYKIEYAIKKKYGNQYIVALMEMNELTEEVYKQFKDSYFEDFGNHLIINNLINPNVIKSINVIWIICVNKKNNVFTNYTNRNVYQYYQRHNLPVGIDLDKKVMYIASQDDGMAKNKYNKLKRMFKKYVSDIILDDNSK